MAGKKKTEPKVVEPKVYVREKTAKELAVEKLSARGITATIESGVVMMRVKTPEQLKEYREAIKAIKYDQSYGFKISKGEHTDETGRAAESIESKGSEDYDEGR